MKQTLNKHAAVIRESGEVAACSLAQEGRQWQSLALGLGRLEAVTKQKQLPSVSLDSMRSGYLLLIIYYTAPNFIKFVLHIIVNGNHHGRLIARVLKGNGAVYKDLNLEPASCREINRPVTC